MDNYICINGKKSELTEEQMKALGIERPKESPFDRIVDGKYYFINAHETVYPTKDCLSMADDSLFGKANYCTDKAIMEQRALHETLSRLLWRFGEMNGSGGRGTFAIGRKDDGKFVSLACSNRYLEPTFESLEITQRAIEEIVRPFMKANPDFVW